MKVYLIEAIVPYEGGWVLGIRLDRDEAISDAKRASHEITNDVIVSEYDTDEPLFQVYLGPVEIWSSRGRQ